MTEQQTDLSEEAHELCGVGVLEESRHVLKRGAALAQNVHDIAHGAPLRRRQAHEKGVPHSWFPQHLLVGVVEDLKRPGEARLALEARVLDVRVAEGPYQSWSRPDGPRLREQLCEAQAAALLVNLALFFLVEHADDLVPGSVRQHFLIVGEGLLDPHRAEAHVTRHHCAVRRRKEVQVVQVHL